MSEQQRPTEIDVDCGGCGKVIRVQVPGATEAEEAASRIQALEAALREQEWADYSADGDPMCGWCGATPFDDVDEPGIHSDHCFFAKPVIRALLSRRPAMKFRKKPVVVEARQIGGYTDMLGPDGIAAWCGGVPAQEDPGPAYMLIPTKEGVMRADVFDWVIKGVEGEFYPCKPKIFAATYEPVEARDGAS